jgi:predicted nucleic acid-binding protein
MNGVDFLADTNFLIYLLEGNAEASLFAHYTFAISSITEIELLGKYFISEKEKRIIKKLIKNCLVLEMNDSIKNRAIELKQTTKIKLPDAVIAATAICHHLTILTADKGFTKLKNLNIVLLEV